MEKLTFFLKVLTHGFGRKMAIFPTFFLRHYRPGKCLLWYSGTKKRFFLSYKNKKFKKSKTWHFSKEVNPWFLFKNGHFRNYFFLFNIGQKNVFYDILKRINAFLGYKNIQFRKKKVEIFRKGLTHGFGSRKAIFRTFFFRHYRPGKCRLRYSKIKKTPF